MLGDILQLCNLIMAVSAAGLTPVPLQSGVHGSGVNNSECESRGLLENASLVDQPSFKLSTTIGLTKVPGRLAVILQALLVPLLAERQSRLFLDW